MLAAEFSDKVIARLCALVVFLRSHHNVDDIKPPLHCSICPVLCVADPWSAGFPSVSDCLAALVSPAAYFSFEMARLRDMSDLAFALIQRLLEIASLFFEHAVVELS